MLPPILGPAGRDCGIELPNDGRLIGICGAGRLIGICGLAPPPPMFIGRAPPPLNPAPPGRAPPIPPPPRPPRPWPFASSKGATNAIPNNAAHPREAVQGNMLRIIQCCGLFFISANSILGQCQCITETCLEPRVTYPIIFAIQVRERMPPERFYLYYSTIPTSLPADDEPRCTRNPAPRYPRSCDANHES